MIPFQNLSLIFPTGTRKPLSQNALFTSWSMSTVAGVVQSLSSETPWTGNPPGSSGGDSPGKNTGEGCHFLLQRSFPTQGSNLGFLQSRRILYQLSHQGSSQRISTEEFWKPSCCYQWFRTAARPTWASDICRNEISSPILMVFLLLTSFSLPI